MQIVVSVISVVKKVIWVVLVKFCIEIFQQVMNGQKTGKNLEAMEIHLNQTTM